VLLWLFGLASPPYILTTCIDCRCVSHIPPTWIGLSIEERPRARDSWIFSSTSCSRCYMNFVTGAVIQRKTSDTLYNWLLQVKILLGMYTYTKKKKDMYFLYHYFKTTKSRHWKLSQLNIKYIAFYISIHFWKQSLNCFNHDAK